MNRQLATAYGLTGLSIAVSLIAIVASTTPLLDSAPAPAPMVAPISVSALPSAAAPVAAPLPAAELPPEVVYVDEPAPAGHRGDDDDAWEHDDDDAWEREDDDHERHEAHERDEHRRGDDDGRRALAYRDHDDD